MLVLAAEAVASTVPWWGIPVVAGVFATGGVIASQAVAWRLDSKKAAREDAARLTAQQREDAARWQSEKRRVYAAFVIAADAAAVALRQNWNKAGTFSQPVQDALSAGLQLRQEIELMASRPVRKESSRIWNEIVKQYNARYLGAKSDEVPALPKDFVEQIRTYEIGLSQVARRELGLDDN